MRFVWLEILAVCSVFSPISAEMESEQGLSYDIPLVCALSVQDNLEISLGFESPNKQEIACFFSGFKLSCNGIEYSLKAQLTKELPHSLRMNIRAENLENKAKSAGTVELTTIPKPIITSISQTKIESGIFWYQIILVDPAHKPRSNLETQILYTIGP